MRQTTAKTTLLDLLVGDDNHPALVAPERPPLTYRQLRENIVRVAAQLNSFGLGRGDRIAIAMGNGPEMIIPFFAAAMCGTAAPLNPKYKQEEFAFYYEDTQAKALITLPGTMELAHQAVTPDMMVITATPEADGTLSFNILNEPPTARLNQLAEPDDFALILHTSGTTSRPKRVPIRHRNLVASAHNIIATYNLSAADTALCVMPLFHIHGIVGSMLSTLASGGTVVCPPGFSALEFWKLLETFKPTWYSAVPTMHQMLLARADRNLSVIKANPLRFIRSSSASLPPVVMERIEQVFNAPVLESYSMSEASHMMTSNPLPPKARKPGSVGYGLGVEVGIMNENGELLEKGNLGEVVVKGPNVFDGYENNPEANATAFVNGWFRTGDQGFLDDDGYLLLTGRLKELINRGGEKISPLEVDNVLLRHPAVAESLAFAVPHKTLGEDIHAALVLKGEVSEKELQAHCSALLAEFKVPRKFHILEELPRGATGKLQRINMAKLMNLMGEQ
jgi:acyl-CoA synthetase (AMP-forming)/AMP-acid ligase II